MPNLYQSVQSVSSPNLWSSSWTPRGATPSASLGVSGTRGNFRAQGLLRHGGERVYCARTSSDPNGAAPIRPRFAAPKSLEVALPGELGDSFVSEPCLETAAIRSAWFCLPGRGTTSRVTAATIAATFTSPWLNAKHSYETNWSICIAPGAATLPT